MSLRERGHTLVLDECLDSFEVLKGGEGVETEFDD
jgi:hypothetical protein